jgi:hypothetical protein
MGVYIKGMDRVSDCMYCLFYSYGYCNAKHGTCNSEFGIDADCPLVEVKTPHGDLIDREEIEVVHYTDADGEHIETNAPTVIEAEVE